jgi:hypothetical protein
MREQITIWQDMKYAPKDRQIIIATADNLYIAKWAQNIYSGEEGFCIGDIGGGDRLIVKKDLVLKWTDAPKHPRKSNEVKK